VAVSKRPVYFLPLLPLLSYLAAVEMMRMEWRKMLVWRFGTFIIGLLFVAGVTGLSAGLRGMNSPAPFLKQLQSQVPAGSPLVQLGKDFFPLLYYFPGNIPVVPASADIPAGGFGITSERNLELCAECEVVARSENKPDNGKSALILVRHR